MGVNSRQKGAQGEREARDFLKLHLGCEARRGQQFQGGKDSPDVVTDFPGLHIEVKRVERLNLYDAVEQSERDGGGDKLCVVLHRRNRGKWLAILDGEKFLKVLLKSSSVTAGEKDTLSQKVSQDGSG